MSATTPPPDAGQPEFIPHSGKCNGCGGLGFLCCGEGRECLVCHGQSAPLAPPHEALSAIAAKLTAAMSEAQHSSSDSVSILLDAIDDAVEMADAARPPLAPPREVTEAMVEEALDAYITWSGWREWADEDVKKCRANMRRALTAALNAPARVDENALPHMIKAFVDRWAIESMCPGATADFMLRLQRDYIGAFTRAMKDACSAAHDLSEMRDICGGEVGEITHTPEEQAALERAMGDVARWRPIDTAPKDGSSFLACVGQWRTVCCWHRTGNCWMVAGPVYSPYPRDEQPTDWQPLPDPRAARERGDESK